MEADLDSTARLCDVCSKLDLQRLAHPFYPCRNPMSCSTPPTGRSLGDSLALGSIDDVKGRRFMCDICKIIAECLDKEPPGLDGECRIRESAEFCTFQLPSNVQARDPGATHFHLTQTFVIFDTSMANQFQGPFPPWELKKRDELSTHYILIFQAKARIYPGVGDPDVASSQTEHEFLDSIGGRCVAPQINTQLVRAWLRQCESKHGKSCMPSLQLPLERNRGPTFVVDVIQSCLIDTPLQCRYVALSYVWGSAPVFKHLLENTQYLRETGSLCTFPIPATIRDSLTLVQAIGERYLWVDSICIIQDDLEMQQREIVRMGSIYSKALFTIIAASGDHANSGLPGVEPGSRKQVQKTLKLDKVELLTIIDVSRAPGGIGNTIWAQRAWTFQERVLSNKVLVFSENQVYWSCRAASHSEERSLEEVRDIDRLHLSFPQKSAAEWLSWEVQQPPEYLEIYDDLLSSYRQRLLTYQTDILNAFNGVSEILAALQKDMFFWGLPQSLFSCAMTWFFIGHVARNHVVVPIFQSNGSKEMVHFPSWSWAAWSPEDTNDLPFLQAKDSHVQPVISFYMVDNAQQIVRIKEWRYPDGWSRRLWENEQQFESLMQHSNPRIGQLRFWTSFANVKTVRGWRRYKIDYDLFPPPNFRPDPNSTHYRTEIIHQDYIVIAASGNKLILLAIEWEDGVAYRVGRTSVEEADWVKVENRQWRLITLG